MKLKQGTKQLSIDHTVTRLKQFHDETSYTTYKQSAYLLITIILATTPKIESLLEYLDKMPDETQADQMLAVLKLCAVEEVK